MEKLRLAVVLSFFAALSVLTVSKVLAQGNNSNARGGWGYGDVNHVHTGPPGLSVRPSNK